jgi:hypothetical protein
MHWNATDTPVQRQCSKQRHVIKGATQQRVNSTLVHVPYCSHRPHTQPHLTPHHMLGKHSICHYTVHLAAMHSTCRRGLLVFNTLPHLFEAWDVVCVALSWRWWCSRCSWSGWQAVALWLYSPGLSFHLIAALLHLVPCRRTCRTCA